MLAAFDWITAAITSTALALVFAAIQMLGGTSWFPRLPPAQPGQEPACRDRLRYYAANCLGLLIGAAFAFVFAATTRRPTIALRYSADDGSGHWIAPLFLAMGIGCWLAMVLMDRMVAPAKLVHILHRANRRQAPGIDLRPAARKLGLIVASVALLGHFALREVHTTLTNDGVRWRDWPWEEEGAQPWTELTDVRIVRTFETKTGRIVERPHLGLQFRDGTVLHAGKRDDHSPGFWEAAATFAADHGGLAVRRVERD